MLSRRLKRIGVRLAKQLLRALIMIWVVMTFTFFLIHAVPGNPVQGEITTLIQQGMTAEQAQERARVMYGFLPHQPLLNQYGNYLWQLVHLNLGKSISEEGVGVLHLILAAAPWTIIMVLSGTVVSFLIGVIAGVLAAVKRSSRVGGALTITGSLLHGIPQFVLAILLAYVFTTLWAVFPFGAPYGDNVTPGLSLAFIWSLIWHAILPVATYALSSYGGWMLTMKSSVISVLGDDFILAAELRGISTVRVMRYVARNALLPLFTILALSVGFMFGGSVFIEEIYDYPGLGHLLLSAVTASDYPLMSGAFLLITAAVLVANILADVLYSAIDPRVRG